MGFRVSGLGFRISLHEYGLAVLDWETWTWRFPTCAGSRGLGYFAGGNPQPQKTASTGLFLEALG